MDLQPTLGVNTSPIKLQTRLNFNKSKNQVLLQK